MVGLGYTIVTERIGGPEMVNSAYESSSDMIDATTYQEFYLNGILIVIVTDHFVGAHY